ncbi:MAG: sulfotransferase domain-containing protein [bacterium]|nr:sulfotransferase domain-containing protein [bacterium]
MKSSNGALPPLTVLQLSPSEALPCVYIATYPRSGTTWMLRSLIFLLGGQEAEVDSKNYSTHTLPLMSDSKIGFKHPIETNRPVIVKTHLPNKLFFQNCTHSRTIYILRDGRDVLTSYYFFKQPRAWKRNPEEIRFDADEFARELEVESVKWAEHVSGWLKRPHVFFTAYETLKVNYAEEISAVTEYVGLPLKRTIKDAQVEFVDNFTPDNKFFRKGIIGDWQNYWDDRHKRIFKAKAGSVLMTLGYEKDNNW